MINSLCQQLGAALDCARTMEIEEGSEEQRNIPPIIAGIEDALARAEYLRDYEGKLEPAYDSCAPA